MKTTYSDFWLTWRRFQGERYPFISCHRRNDGSIPIDYRQARQWWGRRCLGADFSDDAQDWMLHLLNRAESAPLQALRHHVSGAIERGEAEPIVAAD
jgi:hypothetical protein